MAQRSAYFTRPGGKAEPPSGGESPTFATSVIGFGGVRIPTGIRK